MSDDTQTEAQDGAIPVERVVSHRKSGHWCFQFATRYETLFDKRIITGEHAERLWNENLAEYKKRFENGEEPEMVIWCGMMNQTDFHTTEKHFVADCMMIEDGSLFEKVYVC